MQCVVVAAGGAVVQSEGKPSTQEKRLLPVRRRGLHHNIYGGDISRILSSAVGDQRWLASVCPRALL
ncbi:hypothetical protein NQZ68_020619 [Dissostichus eleginoides]|nr:hypothetical protein NQZ68_020619 [Dissostichus eleginoides]